MPTVVLPVVTYPIWASAHALLNAEYAAMCVLGMFVGLVQGMLASISSTETTVTPPAIEGPGVQQNVLTQQNEEGIRHLQILARRYTRLIKIGESKTYAEGVDVLPEVKDTEVSAHMPQVSPATPTRQTWRPHHKEGFEELPTPSDSSVTSMRSFDTEKSSVEVMRRLEVDTKKLNTIKQKHTKLEGGVASFPVTGILDSGDWEDARI